MEMGADTRAQKHERNFVQSPHLDLDRPAFGVKANLQHHLLDNRRVDLHPLIAQRRVPVRGHQQSPELLAAGRRGRRRRQRRERGRGGRGAAHRVVVLVLIGV